MSADKRRHTFRHFRERVSAVVHQAEYAYSAFYLPSAMLAGRSPAFHRIPIVSTL